MSSTVGNKMASSTSSKRAAQFRQVQIIIGKEVTLKLHLWKVYNKESYIIYNTSFFSSLILVSSNFT